MQFHRNALFDNGGKSQGRSSPAEDACSRQRHAPSPGRMRMRAVAGVMAPVRMSDGLNIPGAASEIRTLHLRRAGKRDAGFAEGARLHRELHWQTVNTRWRFPRAPPASGGQFQWRTRIGKFLGLAPRSPLAKRQHARAISQRRCRRAAGDSSCARELARARGDFVEGARWHRELPAQNANARRRFPKGVAG